MTNISIQPLVDPTAKTIKLNIADLPDVVISYESEADFTNLIKALLLLMDRDIRINLSTHEIENIHDARTTLVIETIGEIIESYNSTFENSSESIEEQDDLGFLKPRGHNDIPF